MHIMIRGTSLIALAIGLAAPATAQQQVAAADPADTGLADIVVTAQKRVEDGQKAPLAVTVLDSKALAAAHVEGATDLQRVIPSLTAEAGGGAGDPGATNTVFTIRGLGASATGPQGSSGVAAHFDGVYRQGSINTGEFYDLERIEVDPGPQGTLYGRSAAAGAINVIPNKPLLGQNGAEASVRFGNYSDLITQGAVNLAAGDTIAIRGGFQTQDHDGFYANGYDALHLWSARAQILARPTDDLSVRLLGEYTDIHGVGGGNVYIGGPSFPALVAVVPRAANPDPRQASISELCLIKGQLATCRQSVNYKQTVVQADVNYDFGSVVLNLIPAYIKSDRTNINSNAPLPLSTYDQTPYRNEQYNLEARLSSGAGNRFKWVVGANYYENTVVTYVNQFINVIVPVVPLPSPPFPPGTTVRGVAASNAFQDQHSRQRSTAVFGQGTYPIIDTVRVTVGARYNWDKSTETQILGNVSNFVYANTGFGPLPPGAVLVNLLPTPVTTPTLTGSKDFKALTYRVSVDADVGPRSLVYASVGSGYKPGGLNDGGPRSSTPASDPNFALAPDQFFGPEKVTHFEIGSKNRFANNTLQVNVAAYYDDYKNYQNGQTQVVNPLSFGTLGFVVTNAGKARIYGVEGDIKWQATPHDLFGVALNYLDAKFTSYTAPAYFGPNGPAPAAKFDGFVLPNAPKVSANLSYSHVFDLDHHGKVAASVFSHLSDGYFVYFAQSPGTFQPSYTSTTLDLTWTSASGAFAVSAFVNNLEDRDVKVSGGSTAGYTEVNFAPPRLYGGKVAVKF